MHTLKKSRCRGGMFLVLALFTSLSARELGAQEATPATNDPVFQLDKTKSELKLIERFAKIIELKNNITEVSGFHTDIINVTKVDRHPNQIRIHAEAAGVTSLVLVDDKNRSYTVEILVEGDVRHLQAQLNRLFPDASVKAVSVGDDSVVLRGWVAQPENINQMVDIAERHYGEVLNHMRVGGIQQVQLKVQVMEVQRSKIRQLGFNFIYVNTDGYLSSTPGILAPLTGASLPFGGSPSVATSSASLANTAITGGLATADTIFQGFLEALKQESLLKILAEPTLTTTNGRPAQMLAGGEFPILVPQSLGTTSIEWREFGVRMEAVPIILGNGRVRLELQPEVSERDFTNAVNVSGLTVPGLTTRRVNTQVEMRFGETFMLAGLLSMRRTAETHKVPLLGEIPWLGTAFRRVRYDETETELVIMVTPHLAGALGPGQIPAGGPGQFTDVPTDRELYFDGMIEVPKYGERCDDCESKILPTSVTTSTTLPFGGSDVNFFNEDSPFSSDNDQTNNLRPSQRTRKTTSKINPFKGGLFKWAAALKPGSRRATSPRSRQSDIRRRQLQLNAQPTMQNSNVQSYSAKSPSINEDDSTGTSNPRPRLGLIEPKAGLIQP